MSITHAKTHFSTDLGAMPAKRIWNAPALIEARTDVTEKNLYKSETSFNLNGPS
ncbi:hypothetical protein AB5I39_12250 [Sphingomonas sp. MMS24-J45]|uniref:hypothetical protein n=1 Tax=Sphingomonas sp. MMS24-J45 TaxID=3238806 RepID=UPI00384D436A